MVEFYGKCMYCGKKLTDSPYMKAGSRPLSSYNPDAYLPEHRFRIECWGKDAPFVPGTCSKHHRLEGDPLEADPTFAGKPIEYAFPGDVK